MQEQFRLKARVEVFPGKGGWYFVPVPQKYTELTKPLAVRGLVAIQAKLGGSSWQTSLLPKGDGTMFIALPKKVRDAEVVVLGDTVTVSFSLRQR